MPMVAIALSRKCLQREGGWVPLLLWISRFWDPHPPYMIYSEPTFSRARVLREFHRICFQFSCVFVLKVSPKAAAWCSHLWRKKVWWSSQVKPLFCLRDFCEVSVWGVFASLDLELYDVALGVCLMEGSTVFMFREINSCNFMQL